MTGAAPITREVPMLHRWLKPHPNALVCAHSSRRLFWMPLVHLIWLFWLISSPWLFRLDTRLRVVTGLSLALFLVLYFRAWYGDRRRALWNALAIALLGLGLMPGNPAGWVYLIYALALLPFCLSSRSAARLGAVLLAAMVADALLLSGFRTLDTLSAVAVAAVVFGLNQFASLERRRQAELRLSHDEVRRLAASAERERIARDLHDLLGHTLSLIAIKSELALRLLDRDAARARDELTAIEQVARQSLAEVRAAVTGMRAPALAAELAAAKLMLEAAGIRFECPSQVPPIPPEIESVLALALREAVTNVQRHAGATRVEIAFERQRDTMQLLVRDDGRGGIRALGNGLSGMQERIRALGGRVVIESPPGAGTRLCLVVPVTLRPHEAPSAVGEAGPVAS